jgi:cell wall-associated NlpC family hydrolase
MVMPRNTAGIFLTAVITVLFMTACSTAEKQPETNAAAQPGKTEKAPAQPALSQTDRMMRVALDMRGKPYSYNGSTPEGFDASGLVYYCHKQVDLDIPRSFKEQFEQSKQITRKKIRPGDLLFFSLGTDRPNHVGIYLGSNKFIHAPPTGHKVVMSDIRSKKWVAKFVRGGRL